MVTPPIPPPNDRRVLRSTSPSIAAALGHFLLFGIFGQIIFTFLIVGITTKVNGSTTTAVQASAKAASDQQMNFIWIPLVCGIVGMVLTKKKRIGGLERPWVITLLVLTTVGLWLFDLFAIGLTSTVN